MNVKKARVAAEHIARDLEQEYNLDWEWEGNTLNFERPGVTGRITVSRREVEIVISLGFLLMGLRRDIDREIHEYCDQEFGKASKAIV